MATSTITAISAREILDSRGNPTLLVTVSCGHTHGTFAVPSGASTGSHEALELRDGDQSRFGGRGVLRAATHVNVNLAGMLIGMDASDQRAIDERMIDADGAPTKSKLGGNAIIGVSIACARAAAAAHNRSLIEHLRDLAPELPSIHGAPYLAMNVINGGKHASSDVAFQEYKIIPQTHDIHEALAIGSSVSRALRDSVAKRYGAQYANVGDEGGLAANFGSIITPLELLSEIIHHLHLEQSVKFALDVAASSFYDATTKLYHYDNADHTAAELDATLRKLIQNFPLQYIEDPFEEESFADFASLNDGSCLIIGDDLTVTNTARMHDAIAQRSIGGVIIKPNQVGTLSETIDALKLAHTKKLAYIVSHRSGETNDAFIADLALAYGAYGVKAGGLQRGERIAKYNRFLELLG